MWHNIVMNRLQLASEKLKLLFIVIFAPIVLGVGEWEGFHSRDLFILHSVIL